MRKQEEEERRRGERKWERRKRRGATGNERKNCTQAPVPIVFFSLPLLLLQTGIRKLAIFSLLPFYRISSSSFLLSFYFLAESDRVREKRDEHNLGAKREERRRKKEKEREVVGELRKEWERKQFLCCSFLLQSFGCILLLFHQLFLFFLFPLSFWPLTAKTLDKRSNKQQFFDAILSFIHSD